MYIHREIEPFVQKLAGFYPVVTITGPRQSGKTTLIRHLFPNHAYFNLETPDIRELANHNITVLTYRRFYDFDDYRAR